MPDCVLFGSSKAHNRKPIDHKGDIPDVIGRFQKRREENPTDRKSKCFSMLYSEIKENGYDLSISKYKEIKYEEMQYEKPEVVLDQIEALKDQIKANIAELRKPLGQN